MGWIDSIDIGTFATLLLVALFAPLVGTIVAGVLSTRQKIIALGWFNSFCIFIAFLASVVLGFSALQGVSFSISLFDWIVSGSFRVDFGFSLDMVSAVMIVVITLVSLLVHIYSIGYMENDVGFNRYFSFLSGFVFSMMFLVLSDNFLGLFVGWEGVGVCSYLLIGFWYRKHSANFAAMEAFISNRIADLGMLLGIFLLFWSFGTLNFQEIFHAIASGAKTSSIILSCIGILLFIGAMGKSAQFPLHTWLANAMEGPTPVSALIHAATMVTAGVYLVVRAHPIYMEIPHIGEVIAYLGAFVALFAASMALVNRDVKRIIAYSTLSQLGYMFVAAGLGAYWIALFHLFTHAFFKSLLFLGAGNVMHAMHDGLDVMRMGRLARPLKYTMIFMLIGNLALCGIPPFAGYFSKDLILEFSFNAEYKILWGALVFGAFLTAFYSFRLFMLVFFSPKSKEAYDVSHPHEAKPFMLYAMTPLALLAIISGMLYDPVLSALKYVLAFEMPHGHLSAESLAGIALGASCFGIIVAFFKYRRFTYTPSRNIFYTLLLQQYYIPKLYELVFVKGFGALCRMLWLKVEILVFDKSMQAVGKLVIWLSTLCTFLQNGSLNSALRLMAFGILLLLISLTISLFMLFWR